MFNTIQIHRKPCDKYCSTLWKTVCVCFSPQGRKIFVNVIYMICFNIVQLYRELNNSYIHLITIKQLFQTKCNVTKIP